MTIEKLTDEERKLIGTLKPGSVCTAVGCAACTEETARWNVINRALQLLDAHESDRAALVEQATLYKKRSDEYAQILEKLRDVQWSMPSFSAEAKQEKLFAYNRILSDITNVGGPPTTRELDLQHANKRIDELVQKFEQRERELLEQLKAEANRANLYMNSSDKLFKECNKASARADSTQQSILDMGAKVQALNLTIANLETERNGWRAQAEAHYNDYNRMRAERDALKSAPQETAARTEEELSVLQLAKVLVAKHNESIANNANPPVEKVLDVAEKFADSLNAANAQVAELERERERLVGAGADLLADNGRFRTRVAELERMLDSTTDEFVKANDRAESEAAQWKSALERALDDTATLRVDLRGQKCLVSGWRRRFELTHGRYAMALDFLRMLVSEGVDIPLEKIRAFLHGATPEARLMAQRIYAERQVLNACSKLNANRMKNWAHSEYVSRDRPEDVELGKAELALRQILKEEAELYNASSKSVDKVEAGGVSTAGHAVNQEVASYVERRSNRAEP